MANKFLGYIGFYLIITSLLFLAIIGFNIPDQLSGSNIGIYLSIIFAPIILIQIPIAILGNLAQIPLYPAFNYITPLIILILGGYLMFSYREDVT